MCHALGVEHVSKGFVDSGGARCGGVHCLGCLVGVQSAIGRSIPVATACGGGGPGLVASGACYVP